MFGNSIPPRLALAADITNEPTHADRDGVTQEEYELSLGRVWKIGAVEVLFYDRRANEVVPASYDSRIRAGVGYWQFPRPREMSA